MVGTPRQESTEGSNGEVGGNGVFAVITALGFDAGFIYWAVNNPEMFTIVGTVIAAGCIGGLIYLLNKDRITDTLQHLFHHTPRKQ